MPEKITSTKEFIARNQNKIIVASFVVMTAYAAALVRNKREFDKFLEEKNLLDEFYNPEA